MNRFGLILINILVVMFTVSCVISNKSHMKENGGHDSEHSHGKKTTMAEEKKHSEHDSDHGHDKKPASTEDKIHSGHGGTKSDHDHQGTTMPQKIPKHLDVALAKYTEQANFFVGITSQLNPVAINKIHNWVLQIKKPDGERVFDANVHISGGMPMHGHGLPTSPRVTKYLDDGKYLIEGVRFNMVGWWELKFMIKSGQHKDKVTFNLILK